MGMRVQEGDRSGEQGKKVAQLNDAVSDLLQVSLAPAMQSDIKMYTYSLILPFHMYSGLYTVVWLLSVPQACKHGPIRKGQLWSPKRNEASRRQLTRGKSAR